MSVEAILKTKGSNVFTVRPEHSVADAANLLTNKKVGVAVVCDAKGKLVGVLSERDIVKGLSQYGKGALEMAVRNVMSSPVVTCAPGDSVKAIMEVMTERRIRHLPVVEKDELLGIVSIGDAVNFRLHEAQLEMSVLRDFAATR
ncbi:CBS domain-containing protein [Paramagnetospirillum marisnigri]|uniref:CBS domain-containing protein n=1 Tax=Paramagnetospirillum marisnigri TaxID=1285242 RepID=A0A178MSA6_9PROT|nr:CBS domain-containing protein [Paramagnetospirillum marisnigri]OAN52278.1 CBS domain-containing protein [Paramagnetospirillum marisnigri]